MQVFDILLAPGAVREINVRGSYIYFLNGSAGGADTTISVQAVTGSDVVLMKPGQAFRLPQGESYTQWILKNHAGAGTIVGQVFVGEGDFFDNRISGSVEVIDGGKARTLGGGAFVGGVTSPPVVAQYSHAQIWNPLTSNVNVIVGQLMLNAAAAQNVSIKSHNAALEALYGKSPSKRIGGAVSVSELRTGSAAGYIPTTADMLTLSGAANSSSQFKLLEPIVVPPGQGLVAFVNNAVNTQLSMSFEFYEERI